VHACRDESSGLLDVGYGVILERVDAARAQERE
jgi:hypothetical protein